MYSDYSETKVFFTRCNADGCAWEDPESHSDPEDCAAKECSKCGCDDVVIESEYV